MKQFMNDKNEVESDYNCCKIPYELMFTTHNVSAYVHYNLFDA